MKVVDPHIHLWDTREMSSSWLEKPGVGFSGDYRLLPQPYDVAAFKRDAGDVEVTMSVDVEANSADPLGEAQWLQGLADAPENGGHPHGIVAGADLSDAGAVRLLEQLTTCPNVRGIRQILNVHADKRFDGVGRHYVREPQWRENLSQIVRFGWSFDLQIYPSQVMDVLEAVDANPNLLFIVNHAGMFVDRNSVRGYREWRDGLRSLAARANVVIKLSGFAMFDHHWTVESFRPYVLEAIDAFGADRCMFASNSPIDGLHGSYSSLWSAYADIVSGASEDERAGLFRANAIRYYKL